MGTIVTYPRERHAGGKQLTPADIKDAMDREILARVLLENVRKWVADPTRDVIVGMDLPQGKPAPKLTDEQTEERDKAGLGS